MTLSDFHRITDELLSAYIDDEVTEQERALIEAALIADKEIAWRLNSMRQTVNLLHDLPELPLPRSFTLTFDQALSPQADSQSSGVRVSESVSGPMPVARPLRAPGAQREAAPSSQAEAGFWEQMLDGWRGFWQGGNPVLRNAAAVSFALMLFLVGGGQLINRALTQPAGMMATAPSAAPAAASEAASSMSAPAPAAESVALAPTAEAAATQAESLQVQEESANKAAAEENARAMPAEEADASEEAQEAAPASDAARTTDTSEAPVVESAAAVAEASEESTLAQEDGEAAGEAAIAAAPAAEPQPEVAAMAAPPSASQPPFPGDPRAQGGGGPGLGGGGGGEGVPPIGGGGGGEAGLVPEQAYDFEVDPLEEASSLPAEEAVSASAAAAPAEEEAPAAAVTDVEVTPAVDAVATPTEEAATMSESAVAEPAATATPEAVALVAPETVTSSEVIEIVQSDDAVVATGTARNLPVVWVAQGAALLITVMLTSLWWRSRTPRRARGQ